MADNEPLEETAPKQGGSKMMLIITLNVVLLGGGAAAFLLMGGGAGAQDAQAQGQRLGKLVALDAFIVNLNEVRSTRYLKVTFSLELAADDVEEAINERKPIIRDRVLTYLSGLTVDDVRGSDTKEAIRENLVKRTNEALARDGAVRNVLFTEFVVQ